LEAAIQEKAKQFEAVHPGEENMHLENPQPNFDTGEQDVVEAFTDFSHNS
jgi:hypothetical protein